MPGAGLEPACPEGHPILSRARLTSSATPAAPGYRYPPAVLVFQSNVVRGLNPFGGFPSTIEISS